MMAAGVLTERELEHLRAAVGQSAGMVLRVGGPWHRMTFNRLSNLGLVRIEVRAGIRRMGECLFTVEETWVFATARGIATARQR